MIRRDLSIVNINITEAEDMTQNRQQWQAVTGGLPVRVRHDCVMVQCVQSTAEAGKSVECFTENRPTRKQTK